MATSQAMAAEDKVTIEHANGERKDLPVIYRYADQVTLYWPMCGPFVFSTKTGGCIGAGSSRMTGWRLADVRAVPGVGGKRP